MSDGHRSETRSGATQTAAAIFSSEDAVERLSDKATNEGYLPGEDKAITRYFTEPNADVLDVGCGAGRLANLLEQRGFDVTGTDISRPMVEQARSAFPDVEFAVDDVADSDLDSNAFDYAFFSDVGIDYIAPEARRRDALRELFRVLRPGGILAISSHNSWSLLPHLLAGEFAPLVDLFVRHGDENGLFSRYKTESVNFGTQRVYFSNPLRQRLQFRRCGFTFVDVVGKRECATRYLERSPLYVAKK